MKKKHVTLSKKDKRALEHLIKKGKLGIKEYKRAIGLQELNKGETIRAVAKKVEVTEKTVGDWRDRYKEEGLKMLKDKPRSGRPPIISGLERAKITALACSKTPEGYSQWSLRLLADKAVELGYCEHISYTEVSNILKKTN